MSGGILPPDPSIAPRHVEIEREIDGFYLKSLQTGGVLINAQPVIDELRLVHGDVIQMGNVKITFE